MAGSFPESDEEGEHDEDDRDSRTSSFTHGSHDPTARRIGAPKADDGLRLDGIAEDDPKFDWNQSMGVD